MGAVKTALFDLAERYDRTELLDDEYGMDTLYSAFAFEYDLERFWRCCDKARNMRDITRLWNWADNQDCSDQWFRLLTARFPLAFRNARDANSLRFTY